MNPKRGCGCVKPFHSISCRAVAANEPHAMTNDLGDIFFPDDAEEAAWFAREHGARPFNPDAFRAMFGDVEGGGIVMGCCGRPRPQPTPKPAEPAS